MVPTSANDCTPADSSWFKNSTLTGRNFKTGKRDRL
jgi:hypothetical protein